MNIWYTKYKKPFKDTISILTQYTSIEILSDKKLFICAYLLVYVKKFYKFKMRSYKYNNKNLINYYKIAPNIIAHIGIYLKKHGNDVT